MGPTREVPEGLKKTIRAVLLSTNGVKVEQFANDFNNLMGYRIEKDLQKLDFKDIAELIAAIPDVA